MREFGQLARMPAVETEPELEALREVTRVYAHGIRTTFGPGNLTVRKLIRTRR